jgi:cytochrome b561
MGGAVAGCVGCVLAAQNTKGERKGDLMFLHKSFGLLSLGLLGPRILTRLLSATPGPLPGIEIHLIDYILL